MAATHEVALDALPYSDQEYDLVAPLRLTILLTSRIQAVSCAYGRLQSRVFDSHELTSSTKIIVCNQCLMPLLLYGCETWTLCHPQIRLLRTLDALPSPNQTTAHPGRSTITKSDNCAPWMLYHHQIRLLRTLDALPSPNQTTAHPGHSTITKSDYCAPWTLYHHQIRLLRTLDALPSPNQTTAHPGCSTMTKSDYCAPWTLYHHQIRLLRTLDAQP